MRCLCECALSIIGDHGGVELLATTITKQPSVGSSALVVSSAYCNRVCVCSPLSGVQLQFLPRLPGAHGVGRGAELPAAASRRRQQPDLARRPRPEDAAHAHRQAAAAAGHRGHPGESGIYKDQSGRLHVLSKRILPSHRLKQVTSQITHFNCLILAKVRPEPLPAVVGGQG